ncbi:MAG: tRNA 2-thiocytidine biosynthesis TtcA family protein [Candidatus Nezhaarchaeota archaeon]|nr:tRNA 2-thiocytidine biosynthesis TtcA family protein [Candidatus Nezhaarchaeota archaeon]
MKCSLCGLKAVVRIRPARRALCPAHLEQYLISRVRGVVEGYLPPKGGLLLVAVSGGKDSAAAASLLEALSVEKGFRLGLVHIDLGIEGYSEACRLAAVELSRVLGRPLALISLEGSLGVSVVKLAKSGGRPICSTCGLVKRYLLNLAALEAGAHRLATGHNLDDIAAYLVKAYLTKEEAYASKLVRHTETAGGLVGRLRPLMEVEEEEALAYALSKPLPFSHQECPYVNRRGVEFKAKRFLASLEADSPGFKLSFVRRVAKQAACEAQLELKKCEVCGAASSAKKCAFCRVMEKALGGAWSPRAIVEAVAKAVASLKQSA